MQNLELAGWLRDTLMEENQETQAEYNTQTHFPRHQKENKTCLGTS